MDPDDVKIVRTGKDSLLDGQVIIVSYDLLPKKTNEIRSFQFRVVIAVSVFLVTARRQLY